MFKADSELNHYSVLLRNKFFLQTGFYLASPFRRKRQRNTQKVFFSLENIIPEFLCSLYRIGTGEECWLTEKELHPHCVKETTELRVSGMFLLAISYCLSCSLTFNP